MSLFKRGNVWWAYLYSDGVRHQFSTGTCNRRQAETIEAKLKEEANKRRFQIIQADPNLRFGDLAARFIASGSVRPHHLYHLKFLLPYFSETPVLRITRPMADEFRRQRHLGNSIKEATINRDLSTLRHILYWGVDEQLIQANPLARLKMARERRTRRQVLSVAEEQLLLAAAKNHLRVMVIAALDSGMRRGEITSQRWEDIDFSRNVLFVTRSKTPEGESREIPLTERLVKLLIQQRKDQGLVVEFRGRAVRIIKRTWQTALRNAGLRRVRFHDLRHTFNTRLMEAGVLQEVRMALMGHSSGSKVHATYTHIELPVLRKAIRRLEQWHDEQLQQMKEESNASTETTRTESAASENGGPQTVEKENAGRGRPRTGGQAESRDRRDGRRSQDEAQAASQVRGGEKDLRGELNPSRRGNPMELLTADLRDRLPGLCGQEPSGDRIVIYARFFIRNTTWDWYVAEGQQVGDDFEFYGYIRGDRESWDTFLLSDLEISRGPDGSRVERDPKFKTGNFTEIVSAPDS